MKAALRAHAGLVVTGVATFVVMGIGQSLYGPALPAFQRALGASEAQAGLLVSAHWVGCALGIAAMFALGDRISPRWALGIMTLGAAGVAALAGLWATLAGAVVFGIGYGMATAVFNPRVLLAFGDRGPSMLSLLNACFGLGAILSPLAFVWMGSDPRLSFGLASAMCALIWLAAGAAGGPAARTAEAARRLRLHPPILAFGVTVIGLEACLIGLGPTALIAAGETEDQAARLLSLFFILFLAARVALVFVAHLIPSFSLLTGSLAVSTLGAALAVWWWPAAGFVLIGLAAGAFFPGYYVTATRKMGDDHRVPPTIIAGGLAGGITAPLILAPVMGSFGERGFFVIVLAITATATLAAVLSLRGMNR